MTDGKRRPIADFLILAREQPNAALGWGLAILALLAVVGFGVVKAVGGSSHSSANASTDGGAQFDGSGGGSSSGPRAAGDSTTTKPAKRGSSSVTTGPSPNSRPQTGAGSDPSGNDGTGGGTVPTLPPAPTTSRPPLQALPMSAQRWVASPSNIHMKAGKTARGYVYVTNESNTWGTVPGPGCSGGPSTGPPTGRGPGSCYAGKTFVVQPHRSQKFMWTWHATSSGRAGAPPLAPGSYFFAIGPVSVHVTVK